jgi:FlaG/FlaF family flagellin (archaellin)
MAGTMINNIFIAISVILNGVLLAFLFGLVPFL